MSRVKSLYISALFFTAAKRHERIKNNSVLLSASATEPQGDSVMQKLVLYDGKE